MSAANNKKLLKDRSKTLIIRALQAKSALSRQEMSAITQLSLPAVTKIVQELLDEGMLFETGLSESTGGRRPEIISINPKFENILGIDLETDSLRLMLTDFTHAPLASRKTDANFQAMKADEIHDFIRDAIQEFKKETAAAFRKVKCAGFGIAGYADSNGKVTSSGLGNLGTLDTGKFLPGLPVFVENNANAEAIREHATGLAKGKTDFLCLSILRNGVGSGLFLDGRLYHGAGGMAGEYGCALGLWDDTCKGARRDMEHYARVSARTACLAYSLLNLQRIYVCAEVAGVSELVMTEMRKVFSGNSFKKDGPPVDITESGPFGVCLGAAVHARERRLGHVEFSRDHDIWKRISQQK